MSDEWSAVDDTEFQNYNLAVHALLLLLRKHISLHSLRVRGIQQAHQYTRIVSVELVENVLAEGGVQWIL